MTAKIKALSSAAAAALMCLLNSITLAATVT